jgi:hypothetical protein
LGADIGTGVVTDSFDSVLSVVTIRDALPCCETVINVCFAEVPIGAAIDSVSPQCSASLAAIESNFGKADGSSSGSSVVLSQFQ